MKQAQVNNNKHKKRNNINIKKNCMKFMYVVPVVVVVVTSLLHFPSVAQWYQFLLSTNSVFFFLTTYILCYDGFYATKMKRENERNIEKEYILIQKKNAKKKPLYNNNSNCNEKKKLSYGKWYSLD